MNQLTDKQWGYVTLRLTLGVNMLMHGLSRIVSGPVAFADKTAAEFESGMLPVPLARLFLLAVPYIELVIGVLMVLGLQTRLSLVAGGFLITLLTFGVTSNQNWSAAGAQVPYAIAFFILLYTREQNRLCMDKAVPQT